MAAKRFRTETLTPDMHEELRKKNMESHVSPRASQGGPSYQQRWGRAGD